MKEFVTASIALLSLMVSLITFYLTQIRKAKLAAILGPMVKLYHADDGVRYFLPVTFVNSGAQSGIVFRCAIILNRADNPEENYYMEWQEFRQFNKSIGLWDFDDMATPIAVGAKSAERRNILFHWPLHQKPLILREGLYSLRFLVWTGEKRSYAFKVVRQLSIDAGIVASLDRSSSEKTGSFTSVTLDRVTDSARLMTRNEVESLIEMNRPS